MALGPALAARDGGPRPPPQAANAPGLLPAPLDAALARGWADRAVPGPARWWSCAPAAQQRARLLAARGWSEDDLAAAVHNADGAIGDDAPASAEPAPPEVFGGPEPCGGWVTFRNVEGPAEPRRRLRRKAPPRAASAANPDDEAWRGLPRP